MVDTSTCDKVMNAPYVRQEHVELFANQNEIQRYVSVCYMRSKDITKDIERGCESFWQMGVLSSGSGEAARGRGV